MRALRSYPRDATSPSVIPTLTILSGTPQDCSSQHPMGWPAWSFRHIKVGTLFAAPGLLNLQVRQRSLRVPHTTSLVSHQREVRFSSRTTAAHPWSHPVIPRSARPNWAARLVQVGNPYLIHSGKELVPSNLAILWEQANEGRDINVKKQLPRERSVPPTIPWRSRVAPQLATRL